MTTTDPAVQFWLRYVEAEGGLHEDAGDQVLAMLPEELRTALDLPEEVAVTADPEVAREDGALLLLPGHPVLDQAAASVLEQGDGGSAWLPWPEAVLPAPAALLERARERFDVDHGRIDAGGHPARVYLPVLRVGALVSYTAGLGGRFQEREEVWVDARSGLALGGSLVRTVAQAPLLEVPDASHRVLVPDLVKALAGAHASIEDRALARREALATQAQAALREELARTDAYYEAALASIAKRRAQATPDRRRLLDAQAEATGVERARRRAEIEEKFRPSHEVRPYRLHLLLVPALELPVQVRRGAAAYPFALTWVLPRAGFADVCCPHCGAADRLVAGRDRLGCRACLGRPAAAAPPPPAPVSAPVSAPDPGAAPPPSPAPEPPAPRPPAGAAPSKPPRRPAPAAARPTRKPGRSPAAARAPAAGLDRERFRRAAGKLPAAFWETVAGGERWPRKQVAPGSPLSVLYRLYGAEGPACAVGIPPGQSRRLASITMMTASPYPGLPNATTGVVQLDDGSTYPYTLRWSLEAGKPVVAEVLPFPETAGPVLPSRRTLHPAVAERLYDEVPGSPAALDPVAAALWDGGLRHLGLPLVVRCLAAWWRLREQPSHPPAVLAAALATLVAGPSGAWDLVEQALGALGVDPAEATAAANDLQQRLRLSSEQPW